MKPLFSIITLNWNRKEDVGRTLDSMRSQSYVPKEIIVVDNGSTDGSVESLKSSAPDVRLVELPENLGVEGYNRGIQEANGEYVMLVDNDMDLLQPDTMEKALVYFNANPKLGAVALQVRLQDHRTLSPNSPKYSESKGDSTNGYPCSTFDGGGVAFRKSVLKQVGPYLPHFFVYHSEVELATRIWDAGYEIRYFPDIAVSHRESPVSRNPRMHTFYATRNYLWYVWLYYPAGMGLWETLHFLQRSLLQNIRQKRSLTAWLDGIGAAFFGWHKLAQQRKPAKPETIRWMQQLREEDRARKDKTA